MNFKLAFTALALGSLFALIPACASDTADAEELDQQSDNLTDTADDGTEPADEGTDEFRRARCKKGWKRMKCPGGPVKCYLLNSYSRNACKAVP